MANLQEILKHHDLRLTEVRQKMLDLFLSNPFALSHYWIEQELEHQFDRVTIYRTLKTFEQKGLIHRILDDTEAVRYAYCHHHHEHQNHLHSDNHVHFKCNQCGNTFCLDNVLIPKIELPLNFTANQFQFLVLGTCKNCQKG